MFRFNRLVNGFGGQPTQSHLFWFNGANQRGSRRNDDRLILSGMMQVGCRWVDCRWVDCPKVHGLHKTIDNRFDRGRLRGIWQRIFAAAPSRPPEQAALGCHHGKVHRCVSRGKGGAELQAAGPSSYVLGSELINPSSLTIR
jgi:transposase